MHTASIRGPDGRELCVDISGEPGDQAIFALSGTPNSRHLYRGWTEDAAARGIAIIGYDRPGYGGSTPDPGHSVADGAADVRAIAESLGVKRAVVWGFSGGGPYAVACAARLPDLVAAAAILGSIAPWSAPGLDFFADMGEENVESLQLYFSDREAAREKSREDRDELVQSTVESVYESFKTLVSAVDAEVLSGEFAAWLVQGLHDGLASGDEGWWDDGVAHLSPWGFELEDISVPVHVWHGRHDRFVPQSHGRWLSEHVPGAGATLSEDDGHLTLVTRRIGEVHDWLLSHLGSSAQERFSRTS